jgi:hypothetical protein
VMTRIPGFVLRGGHRGRFESDDTMAEMLWVEVGLHGSGVSIPTVRGKSIYAEYSRSIYWYNIRQNYHSDGMNFVLGIFTSCSQRRELFSFICTVLPSFQI